MCPHQGGITRRGRAAEWCTQTHTHHDAAPEMNEEWILQKKETRRLFSTATWVPLRASVKDEKGDVREAVHSSEYFGLGSAAFPPEQRAFVEERLRWGNLGIGHTVEPYAYKDGYASIDQYQYNDKEPIANTTTRSPSASTLSLNTRNP